MRQPQFDTKDRIHHFNWHPVSPITHFLASWSIGERFTNDPRERQWITAAGLVSDLDGLGIVLDIANRLLGRPDADWYGRFHHLLLHGAPGALAYLVVAGMCGVRGFHVWLLMTSAFHLHLICDLAGSRGPSAQDIWGIDYLSPLNHSWVVDWRHQWPLNGWPNLVITLALILWTLFRAVQGSASPLSLFSSILDARFVGILRQRWNPHHTGRTPV